MAGKGKLTEEEWRLLDELPGPDENPAEREDAEPSGAGDVPHSSAEDPAQGTADLPVPWDIGPDVTPSPPGTLISDYADTAFLGLPRMGAAAAHALWEGDPEGTDYDFMTKYHHYKRLLDAKHQRGADANPASSFVGTVGGVFGPGATSTSGVEKARRAADVARKIPYVTKPVLGPRQAARARRVQGHRTAAREAEARALAKEEKAKKILEAEKAGRAEAHGRLEQLRAAQKGNVADTRTADAAEKVQEIEREIAKYTAMEARHGNVSVEEKRALIALREQLTHAKHELDNAKAAGAARQSAATRGFDREINQIKGPLDKQLLDAGALQASADVQRKIMERNNAKLVRLGAHKMPKNEAKGAIQSMAVAHAYKTPAFKAMALTRFALSQYGSLVRAVDKFASTERGAKVFGRDRGRAAATAADALTVGGRAAYLSADSVEEWLENHPEIQIEFYNWLEKDEARARTNQMRQMRERSTGRKF